MMSQVCPATLACALQEEPQRIAPSHSFGALAATLVGVATYVERGSRIDHILMIALGFEVLLGSLTITGSLMALGKLQEVLSIVPLTFRFQNNEASSMAERLSESS
jgi:H+-translocating NAD(P) transhydrogenase subunit beta